VTAVELPIEMWDRGAIPKASDSMIDEMKFEPGL